MNTSFVLQHWNLARSGRQLQSGPVRASQPCSGCQDNHGIQRTPTRLKQPEHQMKPPQQQEQSQGLQQQQPQQQQQQYWYNEPGPQHLQAALKLPSWRFQTVISKEPSILGYMPDTLQTTLQALGTALHCNQRTVVHIIEQRPALLLQPQEAVHVLHQLSQLLSRSPQQTAFLLSPHWQLLALEPQQLQQHIQQLCQVMHWSPDSLQQALATAAISPASFLQLLALPLQQTAGRLGAVSTALGSPLAVTAQLVQHHPALLNISPAVLRSRLFALAEADSSSCEGLLGELDRQQLKGLSGLLLLSPSKLVTQLQGLRVVLLSFLQQQQQQQQQEDEGPAVQDSYAVQLGSGSGCCTVPDTDRLAVRLLLRLGTSVSLADVVVKAVLLQGASRVVPAWQQQLAAADDEELAVLLSANHENLAQAKYLAATGQHDGTALLEAVLLPPAEFGRCWPDYHHWLSGNSSA